MIVDLLGNDELYDVDVLSLRFVDVFLVELCGSKPKLNIYQKGADPSAVIVADPADFSRILIYDHLPSESDYPF